jgi:hypothetical protein
MLEAIKEGLTNRARLHGFQSSDACHEFARTKGHDSISKMTVEERTREGAGGVEGLGEAIVRRG